MLTIRQLRAWATKHEPIYFQLYLDKCFWCKQDIEEFLRENIVEERSVLSEIIPRQA